MLYCKHISYSYNYIVYLYTVYHSFILTNLKHKFMDISDYI